MADEVTTTEETTETTTVEEEQRVPYERFDKANKKAKEADARAKQLEREMAELRSQFEERESQGLPELDRLKKDFEKASRRAEEAEQRAERAEADRERSRRERWVTAAAQSQNFADPSDASAFVNLDDIEDEKDAERAVKRLAGAKKHLLKVEEPVLPGRVLQNGQRENGERKQGGIDPFADAQVLADGLRQFASKS